MKKKTEKDQESVLEIKDEIVSLDSKDTNNNEITEEVAKEESTHDDELKKSIDKIMGKTNKSLFDIGVSEEEIDKWKAEFGDIYRSKIGEFTFFWHKVRRGDYVKIMSDKDLNEVDNLDLKVYYRQDIIIKSSVLYPSQEELDKILEENAGISTTLADEVMIRSGFGRVQSEKV